MKQNNGLSVLLTAKMYVFLCSQIHLSMPVLCKPELWLSWADSTSLFMWADSISPYTRAYHPSLLTWADHTSLFTCVDHFFLLTRADHPSLLIWTDHPSLPPELITPLCPLDWSPLPALLDWSPLSARLDRSPLSAPLAWSPLPASLDWWYFPVYLGWPHLTALPFSLPQWVSFTQLWWHQGETSLLCHFWHYVVIKNGILVNSSQTTTQITVSRKTGVANKTHLWWGGDVVGWKQKRQVQSLMWHTIKIETMCFSNTGRKHVQG